MCVQNRGNAAQICIFKIFHQIDCLIFAAIAQHVCGIILGQGGFPVFCCLFWYENILKSCPISRNISCHSTSKFMGIQDRKCGRIFGKSLSGLGVRKGVLKTREKLPNFCSSKKFHQIDCGLLLQTRTISVEEFLRPDGSVLVLGFSMKTG